MNMDADKKPVTKVYLVCCPKTEMHTKKVPIRGRKGPVLRHVSALIIEGDEFYFRFAHPSAGYLREFDACYLNGAGFGVPMMAVCDDCKKMKAALDELTGPPQDEDDGA